MRPTDELTMYAYGLLEPGEEAETKAHVDACPDCAERVGQLHSEKQLLERAAGREPVPPAALKTAVDRATSPVPRRSLVPYALAGALLLGLAGVLLYRPSPVDTTADAGRNLAGDPIDRLIGELRSPNPLRRETAVLALQAYGQAAAAKIRKSDVDSALFPGIRWRAQDPAVLAVLQAKKLDLNFGSERTDVVLEEIGRSLGLKIVVDPKDAGSWDPAGTVTIRVKDLNASSALRLLAGPRGLNVFAEEGRVVLSPDRPPGTARAPIRIGRRPSAALVRGLESASGDERLRAEEELERLSFAAEDDLWAALDSPFSHARERAAGLLKILYDADRFMMPAAGSAAVKSALREKRVTIDMTAAPLTTVVDYLREASEVAVHMTGSFVGNADLKSVTFRGEDLSIFSALTLILEPLGLGFSVQGDIVVIALKDHVPRRERGAPLWTTAEEAARIESMLAALGSRDLDVRRRAEEMFIGLAEGALAPLDEAARLLELPLSVQARALRERLLEEGKPWLLDAGSGAELQALTDEQLRLLGCKTTFNVESVPADVFLASVAKTAGAKLDFRARPAGKVTVAGRDIPLRTLLRAFTRPHGLDFRLEGDTVVVETAAKVRAAVEK